MADRREAWLECARSVAMGQRDGIPCPECGTALTVRWLPLPSGEAGDYHLFCGYCSAETYVFTTNR